MKIHLPGQQRLPLPEPMYGSIPNCVRDDDGTPRVPAWLIRAAIDEGWVIRSKAAGRVGYVDYVAGETVIVKSPGNRGRGATTFERGDPVKLVVSGLNELSVINALDEGY